MPKEWEETRPEDDEEDGGGEVKSFLEHLEDLRWVLIKGAAAVFVGFIVCLIAGNWLMGVLKWPLERAWSQTPGTNHYLTVLVGTNRVISSRLEASDLGFIHLQTNQHLVLRLTPVTVGTNVLLALQPETNYPDDILPKVKIDLLNLSPAGGFMVAFQLALYGGVVLAAPFLIFVIGQFVVPAMKRKEKKYVFRGLGVGTGLFFGGVFFCYLVLMPLALRASRSYSNWLGIAADQWTAEAYISFVCKFMLGMGLGFEMPVVLLILVKLGILDYARLSAMRKYMIIVNLVLGAVLTTPEVLTQVMMAVPLQVLYEISVWIAWYWERRDRKRQAAEEASGTEAASN
ncbi:MAG TPA: twin-arginine translocase subunit TatC [Candidatus Paceibacterota bacterium]|nr:twin-arginine translocase subunit TatC [Verrucomicrobiota bacterium]HRY48220.1 twin-arginine translocase subunit TatC [Candidatus Paceibacterota bacterium]HSA00401.1 twin-arginine translocase subunit TatC [Candidatus Paceibacterota bacterium]